MSEPNDLLNQLAKSQDKPPRSARDLAVLEAAKMKAATLRKKVSAPVEKQSFFASLLSKPLWLGTGSLAAAALSVFVLFGHQVEPDVKVASAPEATASTPAAAPPATVLAVPSKQTTTVKEPVAVVEKIAPMAKADRAIAKNEAQVAAPKVIASAEVAVTAPSQNAALPAPAPAAAPVPAPAPAPAPAPVALAAPVPSAPAADTMARRRESSVSSFNAVDTCVANIKAVPVEKQNLGIELTKQLLESCSRSVPKAQWPADIEWAKKLLDQQQEKSLLKSNEKPQ